MFEHRQPSIRPENRGKVLLKFTQVEEVNVGQVEIKGQPHLIAWLRSEQIPPPMHLRALLLNKLPAFMVPEAFVLVKHLPSQANLPLPEPGDWCIPRISERPTTPLQETLAKIWRKVLKKACMDVNECFFDLGGHSMLAAEVTHLVREETGCQIPLTLIFQNPTIGLLSHALTPLVADKLKRESH